MILITVIMAAGIIIVVALHPNNHLILDTIDPVVRGDHLTLDPDPDPDLDLEAVTGNEKDVAGECTGTIVIHVYTTHILSFSFPTTKSTCSNFLPLI